MPGLSVSILLVCQHIECFGSIRYISKGMNIVSISHPLGLFTLVNIAEYENIRDTRFETYRPIKVCRPSNQGANISSLHFIEQLCSNSRTDLSLFAARMECSVLC